MPDWLDGLTVATPCRAAWDEMSGDDTVRFCARCEKHVYNLSALSRLEAERLVRQAEGELCARFYRRPDGTVVTRDCPPEPRAASVGRRWFRVGGAVLSLQLFASVAHADVTLRETKARAPTSAGSR